MKKAIISLLIAITAIVCSAQEKKFGFKFYGRIRGELFYNSRASNESVDGLFYSYPKDHQYDADGNDLNATPQGSFYMLYTRLGVDIKGPNVGSATTTAKIEIDFRGSGTNYTLPRIRHAYVNLDWTHSQLLVGQTWHPMFGEIFPSMLNLSTGAPFQPFNRSPLIRYRFKNHGFTVTGSAIWQMQYNSEGPIGKSNTYLKNSCVPEFYVGLDYARGRWSVGLGGEMLSLKPRLVSKIGEKEYKVNERVTSFSCEAHVRYSAPMFTAMAKTLIASNLTHASMLGGYGVTDIDFRTGEQKYTPFRHSMTWLNFVYGKKWQPGVFIGYLKNLGTTSELVKVLPGSGIKNTYGTGLDVDQVFATNWQLSYNLPHWKVGVEFEQNTAWYGTLNRHDGRVEDTHPVTNYRVLGVVMFIF